ncbi:hypothetical protein TGAM01_v200343 [Trichoderma gamsii]|uniref:Zn(2)-C6 fungal-type domain-containing protein n=1 Tax=Trichoderma gamsii TaxID=398673 RepID=A0A2P5A2Z9_9HYPO|nr:hypothetical protein TGAM01_v200343 [Trichoderma gamsii]PON30923.1 hypothetical protein TGAM01_v200343 [Trichoderma gamsii]
MDNARPFQRNYKACDNCRLKKKRCELGGDQQGVYGFTGPPCAQCRRERRQCVFREARDTKKRHYSGRSRPITRASGRHGRSEKLQSSSQPDKHSRTIDTAVTMDTNLVGLTASPPSLPFDPSAVPRSGLHGDAQILSDRSSKLVTDTTILKGNDAIDILLEAAAGQGSRSPASLISSQPPSPRGGNPLTNSDFHQEELGLEADATSVSPKSSCLKLIKQSSIEANTLSAWKSSVFVRTGLLSAEHAITLVDAFFNNLAPLTFVGTRSLFHRPDRIQLLLREPLLCTAILLISSRHHSVPAAASSSRRFFIHDELWGRASQIIQRIMLGQGQGLRSVASIEALLLLAEWYPAPLNARSSWDETEEDGGFLNEAAGDSYKYKSTNRTHILKQQDQTRWMLLGAAHSLGHEIGVFEQGRHAFGNHTDAGSDIRDLLLAHMTILAARLGLHTMIPVLYSQDSPSRTTKLGDSALGAWTEFLRFTKSIHEQLLPSETKAKEMLSSGQYTVLAAFFKSGLEGWFDKHLARNNNEDPMISGSHHDILSTEYHSVKLWINGLSMQAIFSRNLNRNVAMEAQPEFPLVLEAVTEAQKILRKAIEWSAAGTLQFHPCRTFYRISGACVFAIKAIALGVQHAKPGSRYIDMPSLFSLLQSCAKALDVSASDEHHPATYFSKLIRHHLDKLQPLMQEPEVNRDDADGTFDFDWNFEQWPSDLLDPLLQLDMMPEITNFNERSMDTFPG